VGHRIILHVDMDAFFAAVEERDDPSLRGKPLVVAGTGRRAIVTTASYAARRLGVRTAMPLGAALRLCPSLAVVPADHRKYGRVSEEVMEAIGSLTPDLEPASIDEAYIDGTPVAGRHGGPDGLARTVKQAVGERTRLTCSVGVAPNKLLAKLASGMEKPDGLTVIPPDRVGAVLEGLLVGELCGIGPKTVEALAALGVRTCGQLGRYPRETLRARFGSLGEALSRMGRGEDDSPVVRAEESEEAKSIGHSRTFDEDLTDRGEMAEEVLRLAGRVARRAREEGAAGRRITLTVRYADFTTFTRQATLPSPVWTDSAVSREALRILEGLPLGQPVRLLGVTLGRITREGRQGSLIPDEERREKVQEALDRINDRFGEGAIRSAALPPRGRTRRGR